MTTNVNCPFCGKEIIFESETQWLGDGCWAGNQELISLKKQDCVCVLTAETVNELADTAIEQMEKEADYRENLVAAFGD